MMWPYLSTLGRACAAASLALFLESYARAGAPAPRPDAIEGPHAPEHQIASLGSFRFASGETIDNLKVSYVTYGKLNPARNNAILSLQHFGGDHHDNEFLTGPGKALDSDKYFIIATDFLGNAKQRQDLTTGPTNSGLKMRFPRIIHRDWVNADYKLVKEYLGIDHVVAIVGNSIGGMNALQFGVSYPDFASSIIPIATSPRVNPQSRLMLRHLREVIALDPGWYSGMYDVNPITGSCTAFLGFVPWLTSTEWYLEEKVPDYQKFWYGICLNDAQDVRDIYYQLDGYGEFNIGDTPGFNGDTRAALGRIKAKTLLIAIKEDQIFRREEMQFASGAIPDARYLEISSSAGHAAGSGRWDAKVDETMNREIAKFLTTIK